MLNLVLNLAGSPATTNKRTTLQRLTDPGRDSALQLVYKQYRTRNQVLDSYRKVKTALKDMGDQYLASKDSHNVITRYHCLKKMIKSVTIYEKQYWLLIDVPKQEMKESAADYVTRLIVHLEQRVANANMTQNTSNNKDAKGIHGLFGSASTIAEKAKEQTLLEALKTKSTDELRKEQERLQDDLAKLCKKYIALRVLSLQLKTEYESTKGYPIIPRYSLLKDLIKNVLRSPAFAEVCHEIDE